MKTSAAQQEMVVITSDGTGYFLNGITLPVMRLDTINGITFIKEFLKARGNKHGRFTISNLQ